MNYQITMTTEKTIQQITRIVVKVAEKFPKCEEPILMTDIHLRASQDTGEFIARDDDENEITRGIVESWIDYKEDDFYVIVEQTIRKVIENQKETIDAMGLIKPFAFVLEDDENEHIAELYLVDDNIAIFDTELLKDLDKDLDNFWEELMKNER